MDVTSKALSIAEFCNTSHQNVTFVKRAISWLCDNIESNTGELSRDDLPWNWETWSASSAPTPGAPSPDAGIGEDSSPPLSSPVASSQTSAVPSCSTPANSLSPVPSRSTLVSPTSPTSPASKPASPDPPYSTPLSPVPSHSTISASPVPLYSTSPRLVPSRPTPAIPATPTPSIPASPSDSTSSNTNVALESLFSEKEWSKIQSLQRTVDFTKEISYDSFWTNVEAQDPSDHFTPSFLAHSCDHDGQEKADILEGIRLILFYRKAKIGREAAAERRTKGSRRAFNAQAQITGQRDKLRECNLNERSGEYLYHNPVFFAKFKIKAITRESPQRYKGSMLKYERFVSKSTPAPDALEELRWQILNLELGYLLRGLKDSKPLEFCERLSACVAARTADRLMISLEHAPSKDFMTLVRELILDILHSKWSFRFHLTVSSGTLGSKACLAVDIIPGHKRRRLSSAHDGTERGSMNFLIEAAFYGLPQKATQHDSLNKRQKGSSSTVLPHREPEPVVDLSLRQGSLELDLASITTHSNPLLSNTSDHLAAQPPPEANPSEPQNATQERLCNAQGARHANAHALDADSDTPPASADGRPTTPDPPQTTFNLPEDGWPCGMPEDGWPAFNRPQDVAMFDGWPAFELELPQDGGTTCEQDGAAYDILQDGWRLQDSWRAFE